MRSSFLIVVFASLLVSAASAAPTAPTSTGNPPPPTGNPKGSIVVGKVTDKAGPGVLPIAWWEFNGNLQSSNTSGPSLSPINALTFVQGKDGKEKTALFVHDAHNPAATFKANKMFRRSAFTIIVSMHRHAAVQGFAGCEHGMVFRDHEGEFAETNGTISIGFVNTCTPMIGLMGPAGPDGKSQDSVLFTATKNVDPDKWSEIMVSYDGSKRTVSVFVDRLSAGTSVAPPSIRDCPAASDLAAFGGPWQSAIDDFKFYDRALTPADFVNNTMNLAP